MLAIEQSYDQAMNNLGTILGATFSVDTAEIDKEASAFLEDLPKPAPGR